MYQILLLNVSELSDITIDNPQSLTNTNDSNILQLPEHNITQNPTNDRNQNDTTHNTNQDNTSTLTTSNTQTSQDFQTQQTSPRNYDPLPLPPRYSIQTTPHLFIMRLFEYTVTRQRSISFFENSNVSKGLLIANICSST